MIPLRKKTTFLAAEQALAAVASSILPATEAKSDDETESVAGDVKTSSQHSDSEGHGDKTTVGEDETDFFRRKRPKALFHPVGHWVSFLDGSQRTLLFTTDPDILRQATQVGLHR